MSENYSPDAGVQPQPPYDTVLLSQRDLGLGVPVNYVTAPGVSLTAACFSHQYYEDDSYGQCLSNLLAVGYRRFEIDLYWDETRKVWSFCPASIPLDPTSQSSSLSSMIVGSTAVTLPSSTADAVQSGSSPSGPKAARQISSQITSSTGTLTSVPVSTSGISLGSILPTITVIPDTSNEPLVTIGPYVCTTSVNLSTFTSQLLDYIQKSQNTLAAHLIYVIINVHAASSSDAPSTPASSPSVLPEPADLIGTAFISNLSDFIYTESNLVSDRTNLKESWYSVTEERYRTVAEYYTTTTSPNGVVSTEDGWPSESYIEFSETKRLLLGWGTVDPQMAGYNFSGDSGTIFANGYIQDIQANININSAGQVTKGCFLDSTTDPSKINASWAVEPDLSNFNPTSDLLPLFNLTTNLTNCGISLHLNTTLLNSTAHENYIPYQNLSYSSIWSWAPGQPRNYTSADASSPSLFRCATTQPSLSGRWTVTDCSQRCHASCRASGQLYNWTVSSYPTTYTYASFACPSGYTFAAPRTALENAYLTQAMRDDPDLKDYESRGIWVDFNSLDVQGCWTMGGPNATCPYTAAVAESDELRKRVILVPTIAAIIVLIITALTVFVKVVGNSQVSERARKRRRNHTGFVYEGVPS